MPLTLVSWNVETLVPKLARLPELLARLGRPDVLCLQEVRIRHHDAELVAQLEGALPGYVCHHSLARDPKNVTFRGGRAYGVATYLRQDLGPVEVEVPAWDLEGRLVLSHLATLTIGNVYAVNGTDKFYFDHELGRVSGDRHAFKRRFQERVLARAKELRGRGGVIMTGDWNVSRTTLDIQPRLRTEEPHAQARAELEAHLVTSGMVDVYRRLHPEERGYTWFNPRSRRLDAARVDYVLVSEELLPAVESAAIRMEASDREGSDHAPITVTIAK